MVNYSNGKIYKIQHISGEGQVYVGSTTKQYLSQRMDTHRSDYKKWKNGKARLVTSYNIFETYGIDNCLITLLESVNANSKDELLVREAYWIKQLDCVNKVIPNRTDKEYYEDHKQEIAEYKKQYQQDNKEDISQNKKQYYLHNKQDISQKHKKYNQDHKEEIAEKAKQYYEKNKQNKLEKAKQTYICITCNTPITLNGKSQHEKTKKHLNNVDSSK